MTREARVTATEARNRNRLDRPVGPADHALGSETAPITLVEYGSYACPHCRAANERIAEVRDQVRRAPALCVPPPPAARQRARAPRRRARRARQGRRPVLGRAHRADEALGDAHRGRPRRRRRGARRSPRRHRRRQRERPRGASPRHCRRDERARERRDVHADVLHQRPALRRAVGRELVLRRHARHARPSRPHRRARLRQLGTVRRRPAAARDARCRDRHQHRLGAGLRALLGAVRRTFASAPSTSRCRCAIGSTTAC